MNHKVNEITVVLINKVHTPSYTEIWQSSLWNHMQQEGLTFPCQRQHGSDEGHSAQGI